MRGLGIINQLTSGLIQNRLARVIVGAVLVIAIAVIWGLWKDWPTARILYIVSAALLLCVFFLIAEALRAHKRGSGIQKSVGQQAEQQYASTHPGKRQNLLELQAKWDEAMAIVKKERLYHLPWYLFIGPPQEGKTTIVQVSGLNFPPDLPDAVAGVGGTRNCNWYFSDEAILLDTAGRYTEVYKHDEEWFEFLRYLKKYRRRQPINGVLVGISIETLLQDPTEVKTHAENIRRRMYDLAKQLDVRFPVYLIITKCDKLEGFVEFFDKYSREELKQIWGFSANKETFDDHRPGDLLDTEFERLQDVLIHRRVQRLSERVSQEDKPKIFGFPMQFRTVKGNLKFFAEQVFQKNPYGATPIFRGFYFTSGTQDGKAIDRVFQSMAEQFDFDRKAFEDTAPETATKSFFVEDLFKKVIIADQHIVKPGSPHKTRASLFWRGLKVAAVVLLVLFWIGALQAFFRGESVLGRAGKAGQSAGYINWNRPSFAYANLLRMDSLRVVLNDLEDPAPPWKSWGLYRDESVRGPLRRLYLSEAREFVETYPLPKLEDRLRTYSRRARLDASLSRADRDLVFQDLRAYLLLTSEVGRLASGGNRSFLTNRLTQLAQDTLARHLNVGEPQALRPQITHQDSTFVAMLTDSVHVRFAERFPPDPVLIADARAAIRAVPDLYRLLKQRGSDSLGVYTLADLIEEDENGIPIPRNRGNAQVFSSAQNVSRFFSRAGYDFFDREIHREDDTNALNWVMGEAGGGPSSLAQRSKEDIEELKRQYFEDYVEAWQSFLDGVRHRPYTSIRRAAQRFAILSDPANSPLLYLIARVTHETQFSHEDTLKTHPITERFRWLHNWGARITPDPQGAPRVQVLQEVLAALAPVSRDLDGLAGGDASDAHEYARGVLQNRGDILGEALRDIRAVSRNSSLARNLFEKPVTMAWEQIVAATQNHLNAQWQQQVCEPFDDTLAGRYPFVRRGASVRTGDFEDFFRRDTGPVFNFIDELREDGFVNANIEPEPWEGTGISTTRARRTYQRAAIISRTFFDDQNDLLLDFELCVGEPDKSQGEVPVGRIGIDVHGTFHEWQMGRVGKGWQPFSWPGSPLASLHVHLQVDELEPNFETSHNDAWAWFRLLEEAQIDPNPRLRSDEFCDGADYELRWPFERGVTIRYQLRVQRSPDPFGNVRGFFGLSCPATL